MSNVKEIISLMESPTKEDVELITKAYNFSENAHRGQKRSSNEPYFVHLFETAKILASIKMGSKTISAGLLHDCIEDKKADPADVKKEFGNEILFLINGVTKLDKIRHNNAERYIGSLQKLFVFVSKDIRVLLIKLADRLHNMRTLKYACPEKQVRIATETLELFAPLAYRIGVRKLSSELEDLAFFYLFPEEAAMLKKLINKKRKENMPILKKFTKTLNKVLVLENVANFSIGYRIKGLYRLYKKLLEKNMEVEKVYDIFAVRVVADNIADCYRILGIIHRGCHLLADRIKDYIAIPKPNGYQSLHTTVFTGDGGIVEIQIRTKEMQENSEYGIVSRISHEECGNKKTKNNNSVMSWFWQLFSKHLPFIDNQNNEIFNEDIPPWIKELVKTDFDKNCDGKVDSEVKSDFFAVRMYIFTPKGDVVDLPIDSTPIDFAYAVNSNIGNHIDSSKVNGKSVSLDTRLNNGDIVEILVKKSAKPSIKWVEIAKTALAKRHIKNFLAIK